MAGCSRENLDLLFRQIPGLIWTTDRDLRITHVSGRLHEEAELRDNPVEGKTLFEVLKVPSSAHPAVAHHLAALESVEGRFRHRFHGRTYEAVVEPLRTDAGEVTGCIGAAVDVTERTAVDEQLRSSRAQLLEAQRLAHVGSWQWDVQADVVTWSEEMHRIYALEPSQFGGRYEHFFGRVHPDDRQGTQAVLLQALREPAPFRYDHRIIRTDGSVRMLHTRGDVTVDAAGKVVHMTGCCWDVTERWEADRERGDATALLQATLDTTADGILVVDRQGHIRLFNRRFLAMWHIPERVASNRKDSELLDYVIEQLEDPVEFLREVRELYAQPEQERFDVLRFKDGRVFERFSAPQTVHDEVTARVWSFRDVTERDRLYREAVFLADASRLLTNLDIHAALDAVARLALPLLGESSAVDLLEEDGFKRIAAVSRDRGDQLISEIPPTVYAGHSTLYAVGSGSCISVPLLARGRVLGIVSFLASSNRPFRNEDLTLAEELGRRAALAVENARLYRKAQEALQSRDDFLAIAAHEIRGPITSLHLALQSMHSNEAPADARERLLTIAEREDARLAKFVGDLLDLGRIRAGRLQFELHQVDLVRVVREVASRLGPQLARSGSQLSVSTSGPVVGSWDAARLDQIVDNLLSNAIKFGMGRRIELSIRADEGKAIFAVHDDGIGIPREMQERVFQPFERAVSPRHYGGLGLGLYIVKTAVEGMGGRIQVGSAPEEGTTFTVELPQ